VPNCDQFPKRKKLRLALQRLATSHIRSLSGGKRKSHRRAPRTVVDRNCVKTYGARGEWPLAAERFAEYWGGTGSWQNMSSEWRAAFSEALKPNFFEWDAVMNETTSVEQWGALLLQATSWHTTPNGFADTRDHLVSPPILSLVNLQRGAWRRSHGAAHSARPDQPNRQFAF
jgi:hypothetical protein